MRLGAAGETPAASCSISRARSCTRIDERDPSASNPAVMAVRLCVCHGDADSSADHALRVSARRVSWASICVSPLRTRELVKGSRADARRAFEALREHYPSEGWGEPGLGILALTEGNAEEALFHIRAARTGGWTIPEVETSVLKYLEGYWRSNKERRRRSSSSRSSRS